MVSISVQQTQHEIKLIAGVDEEVQNLQDSFAMVQARLNNAELKFDFFEIPNFKRTGLCDILKFDIC